MSIVLQWLLIILLFFILLPVVAISIITAIRFVYRKIKKRKTIKTSRFILTILIAVIGLAIIPPVTYIIMESTTSNVTITGHIAYMTNDDDDFYVRYIDYDGTKYQELDTSISGEENYEQSDDAPLDYGKALANVVFEDQSVMEKYIYTVFRYPTNSQLIYSITNTGMKDCISLEDTTIFCDEDTVDKRLEYYRNNDNYNYFAQDYNTDKYYDIKIDNKSIDEINDLANLKNGYDYDDTEESITKTIPGIVKLDVESDYDLLTIIGESKDKLILHEIGEVYVAGDGKMYQIVEEMYREEDGGTSLFVLPVSDATTAKLQQVFK